MTKYYPLVWTHHNCKWSVVRRKGNRVRYGCDIHGSIDPWERVK